MHVGRWRHADFLGRSATLADTLGVLREVGIDGGVLSPTDECDNGGLLAGLLEAVGSGYPGPLWFVPWVRPGTGDLAWVEAHADLVAGIKLHPSLSRARVTDAAFAPALAAAERHGWVVVVHCGRWQDMASYRFALEAASRYPAARWLLTHAGGDTPPLATAAAEAARGIDNVWFEISGVREYWVIERAVDVLGADRYLLGSDYNLAHPAAYVAAVRAMRVGEPARRRILGDNAAEVFGRPLAVRAGGGGSA